MVFMIYKQLVGIGVILYKPPLQRSARCTVERSQVTFIRRMQSLEMSLTACIPKSLVFARQSCLTMSKLSCMEPTCVMFTTFLTLAIFLISEIAPSNEQITIETGSRVTWWKGCILQKMELMDKKSNKEDPCNKCALEPKKSHVVRRKGYPQRMYNCTNYCDRVTICTHARYHNGKDDGTYPLCYECQNWKHEHIIFNLLTEEQICRNECRSCAVQKDLPRAYECAQACQGVPTFCYPEQHLLVHRICYQAQRWYGCNYQLLEHQKNMTADCNNCVKMAKNPRDGHECARDCDGMPTYSNTGSDGTIQYYRCQLTPPMNPGDLFLYDIPRFLLSYFHVSNPSNLYMRDIVARSSTLSGFIQKFLLTPFNMTLLTYPRPKGFEDKRIL